MESLLFDFPNFGLSNDELEPTLSLASLSNKDKEEEDDEWYNIPSNSDSNLDDEAPFAPPPALPKSTTISASASRTTTLIYKEHSISAQIKAITILNNKVPLSRIIKVTGISQNRIYTLAATAQERGRPSISPSAIACVLKVITRNSTTHGFSCKTIRQEVKRRGFQVAPHII
jgi:hypothetical protein